MLLPAGWRLRTREDGVSGQDRMECQDKTGWSLRTREDGVSGQGRMESQDKAGWSLRTRQDGAVTSHSATALRIYIAS